MSKSLVAINIYIADKNTLLNPKGIPILFEWNGEGDLITEFISNETGYKFIERTCCTHDLYTKTKVSYFYFKSIADAEVYNDDTKNIQDILKLSDLKNSDRIYNEYIKEHFNYLYNCSFKEDYKFTENFNNDIISIYNKLKKTYPRKIIKETVINYVRAQLTQENKLSVENAEWIINKLTNILKDVSA